ncbi:MAG: hypothetical protein FWE09_00580 [Treponema sp.]|nr:hypothetical protein [Treponema sp.]
MRKNNTSSDSTALEPDDASRRMRACICVYKKRSKPGGIGRDFYFEPIARSFHALIVARDARSVKTQDEARPALPRGGAVNAFRFVLPYNKKAPPFMAGFLFPLAIQP